MSLYKLKLLPSHQPANLGRSGVGLAFSFLPFSLLSASFLTSLKLLHQCNLHLLGTRPILSSEFAIPCLLFYSLAPSLVLSLFLLSSLFLFSPHSLFLFFLVFCLHLCCPLPFTSSFLSCLLLTVLQVCTNEQKGHEA